MGSSSQAMILECRRNNVVCGEDDQETRQNQTTDLTECHFSSLPHCHSSVRARLERRANFDFLSIY